MIPFRRTAVLALCAFNDAQQGLRLVSAGADGSLAIWRAAAPGEPLQLQARLRPSGAPIFSLLSAGGRMFAGTAARDVLWAPWSQLLACAGDASFMRACGGHTGWVRALAAADGCLFSVGCNFVRAWEEGTLEPLGQARMFTGDITSLAAAPQRLFSGGADGCLRSFAVDAAARPAVVLRQTAEDAHDGRIEVRSACVRQEQHGARC